MSASASDILALRLALPEFTDTGIFSDDDVGFYLTLAENVLTYNGWYDYLPLGQYLFTGHYLALDLQATRAAVNGGVPGISSGVITSKSLGGASISYDVGSAIETDAGHWNLTTYGRRFIRIARMVGTGPVQVC